MIPLSVPFIEGNEWKYIKECLDTNWVSSVGSYVTRFEKDLATYTGAGYAVSTVNGTAALHISLLLAGVRPGDCVLVPNITFVASANSISYAGAHPIFIDICANTWQMDLDLLEEFLEEKTILSEEGELFLKEDQRRVKAIMPVHVLGNVCSMEKLIQLATRFHLEVIEDATESLGSLYKGKHTGTMGKFGCFSFNGNKIITTGGGGMIVTNDEELARKAKHLTTQAKRDPFEYYHDEVGYNYRMVNILAAMGVAQLEKLPEILVKKKQIAEFYHRSLGDIKGLKFQKVNPEVSPNNWLFTVSIPNQKKIISALRQEQIEVRPFWVPMNRLPMYANEIYITKTDRAGAVYENCISLPCSSGITEEQLLLVSDKLNKFAVC